MCDNNLYLGCVQLALGVQSHTGHTGGHGHHSGHNTGHSSGHNIGHNIGPHTDKLHVYTWQIYPDMVVFDWLIKLVDKDRYLMKAKSFWS